MKRSIFFQLSFIFIIFLNEKCLAQVPIYNDSSLTTLSTSSNDTTKFRTVCTPTPLLKQKRIATYTQAGIIVGTLATLNWVWYSKEPRQPLASFNDSKEWLQMDKIGHIFSTYSEAKLSTGIWKWGGLPHKKAVLLGTSMAWLYQMSFEVMDGTVATYGFSWTDVAANTIGAGLFSFQELQWKEQRIIPKLSYWRQQYDPSVLSRVRKLYGTNGLERFLKDYNGQTHWLSANLKDFFPKSKLPKWLNIAMGYGATGMLGGFSNNWKDDNGNTITRNDIARHRQWYLSPDINFKKINTKKKGLKMLFFVLNAIKVPAPALLLSGGKLSIKTIAF